MGALLTVWSLLKRVPWQAYLFAAGLLLAFFWHRGEVSNAYRAGEQSVWAQLEKAKADQLEREREATAELELRRRLEAQASTERMKEIDRATASLPDQAPSRRQSARACVELRRQAAADRKPVPAC